MTETETETETPGLGTPVYVAADVGTGIKALDDNGRAEEITFDGKGTIIGLDFTEHGAYFALAGPDGTVHSHGSVTIATTESDRLAYTYQTLGRSVGDSKLVELGCAFVSSATGRLAALDKAVLVLRTEIDKQAGTGKTLGWEWKG